jgi:hypothetical protein
MCQFELRFNNITILKKNHVSYAPCQNTAYAVTFLVERLSDSEVACVMRC